MTAAELRNAVKARVDVDIAVTTFDTVIDQFGLDSLKKFAQVGAEIAPVEASVGIVNGRATIDLAALGLVYVKKVEVQSSSDLWNAVHAAQYSQHGTSLQIDDLSFGVSMVRLYGSAKMTLANIPDELQNVLIYWTIAEFFNYLMGNKRKFNVYMNGGSGSVNTMREAAEYYNQLADESLEERGFGNGKS